MPAHLHWLISLALLVGCGQQPSPGATRPATSERGGESLACGEGTRLEEGACRPGPGACGPGTQFEPDARRCIACPELEDLRVGYGGTGAGVAGAPAPGWVIGTVALESVEPLEGIGVQALELLDAEGQVVATVSAEQDLRLAPEDRQHGDLSRYGTEDFDGSVPAGRTLLWVHGRLAEDLDLVVGRGPSAYRLTLRSARGPLTLVGRLEGPWPTA